MRPSRLLMLRQDDLFGWCILFPKLVVEAWKFD